jgi:exosortase
LKTPSLPTPKQIAKRLGTTLPVWLGVATLVIATIAFYLQDLTMIFTDALDNEATSYILIIPIILAYLIYRKRKILRATITDNTQNQPKNTRYYSLASGILLCLIAILVYWWGSYTFTPLEYHLATLPILVAGLTLVLFNPQILKQNLFSTIFLIFLTPPPTGIFNNIGSALSVYSSEASTALAQLFRIPATLTADYGTPTITIIRPDTTTMTFAVSIACSGLYSLIGFLVFAVFITYIVRDKTWKKIGVLAIGFPLVYLLNIIRLTTIVSIGYAIGEQTALDVFHLLGGWILIFIGTLILLAVGDKLLKIDFFSRLKNICPTCTSNKTTTGTYCTSCGRITKHQQLRFNLKDTAKLITIITAITLLLWIQMPVFATTHSPAQVLIQTPDGGQGNTQLFPNITGYTLSFEYRDTDFEKVSHQDYSLMFSYTPNDTDKTTVYVGLEIAPTTSSLHRWETCLVTWPETHGRQTGVTQLDLKDTQIQDNPPVIARYFAFQYLQDNETQLVLYWYETSYFTVNNATQQKQVEISLITYPETPQDVPQMETQLLPIAQAIANYWQPVKTWAAVSLFISQNGSGLASSTTIVLIAVASLYLVEARRREKTSMDTYKKLGTQDRQLVDTIRELQKTTLPTDDRIKKAYQQNISTELTNEQLEQKLAELQRIGITRNIISNDRDEPIRAWKT